MVAHHVLPRGRHERAHACDEVERLEQERDRAVFPRLLQRVAKLAARVFFEAVLRDRRAAHIPAQPLEACAIARRDGDLGVYVEVHDLSERLRARLGSTMRRSGWPALSPSRPRPEAAAP